MKVPLLQWFLRGLALLGAVCVAFAQSRVWSEGPEECTIGVAAGRATRDGRPLLWKIRDAIYVNNEIRYDTLFRHKFVSVVNACNTSSWMGVNERGFAILNSNSPDLPGGNSAENGTFMRQALGTCATVADFEQLLDSTNRTRRLTQANFGVIDSTGAAAMYETGDTVYWKFDANDTGQARDGYIVRANFALNGGGSGGRERYLRSNRLLSDLLAQGGLTYRNIARAHLRDFSKGELAPFPIPYAFQAYPNMPHGYISTSISICRLASVSGTVIHGVLPAEPAKLTTMWTILGQPATSLAVPYWPVGAPPTLADGDSTAPLCDEANRLKSIVFARDSISGQLIDYVNSYLLLDGRGNGLWAQLYPIEDSIFLSTEGMLHLWRTNGVSPSEMLVAESAWADLAYSVLKNAAPPFPGRGSRGTLPEKIFLSQNYPNPFNAGTTIRFELPSRLHVRVEVFDLLGRKVRRLVDEDFQPGSYPRVWDGRSDLGTSMASGAYFCRLTSGGRVETRRMVLLR